MAPPEDVLLACPGLVYRRDCIDRLHTGEPHQLDLWRVRRGAPLGVADLREMIETVVRALPAAAVARLGIAPGQKNVLLRVVLRALDRTLTHEECNVLRDDIFAALHRGSAWEWAARPGERAASAP